MAREVDFGFEGEEDLLVGGFRDYGRRVPFRDREIQIYKWSSSVEGWNIFFPDDKEPSRQSADPFEVKMIVQDYINRHTTQKEDDTHV